MWELCKSENAKSLLLARDKLPSKMPFQWRESDAVPYRLPYIMETASLHVPLNGWLIGPCVFLLQ